MNSRRIHRNCLMVVASLVLAAGVPALAQRGELEQARAHIQELVAEAAQAKERGEMNQAEALMHQARQLEERLARAQDRGRDRGPESDRAHLINIIEGLEHGMVALRELGMKEEGAHLDRIANGLRERVAAGQRGERNERNERNERGERGERTERQVAMQQLEIMRQAMPALREGERRDAADLLEHAIHARELALEGRDGAEAMEVRRSGPERGQIAEILMLASNLWEEFGHESKARAVGELGKQFARQARARREGAAPDRERLEAERARERRAGAEREMAQRHAEGGDERVAHLERRLEELAGAMERLHGAMREMEQELRQLRRRD